MGSRGTGLRPRVTRGVVMHREPRPNLGRGFFYLRLGERRVLCLPTREVTSCIRLCVWARGARDEEIAEPIGAKYAFLLLLLLPAVALGKF